MGLHACSSLETTELDALVRAIVPGNPGPEAVAEEAPTPADPGWAESLAASWYVPAPPPPVPRHKPVPLAPGVAQNVEPAEAVANTPDPQLLVGLDFAATKALLGDPALQMERPPAKVWAYNGGTCMFNLFFYPSMDDNVFRVLTYEVTNGETTTGAPAVVNPAAGPAKIRDRDHPALRQCFADLLHNKTAADAG
ncbi:MAG: hypothetical protein D6826_04405 [Alphaproteobacteria bacterium]|nr:MAG: hypothetical protein D6826_04405 [Alphaproteobacteria bacterium]